MTLIRKTVHLEKRQVENIENKAKKREISFSQMTRDVLNRLLFDDL